MSIVRWLRLGALSIALGCLLLAARGPLLSAQEPELLAVTSVDGQGSTLYAEPSTGAEVVALLPDGSFVWVAGPDVQAEEGMWRQVQDAEGRSGYLAADLVAAVSPASVVEAQPPLADLPPPQIGPFEADPAPQSAPRQSSTSTATPAPASVARPRSTPTPTPAAGQSDVARSPSRPSVSSVDAGDRKSVV